MRQDILQFRRRPPEKDINEFSRFQTECRYGSCGSFLPVQVIIRIFQYQMQQILYFSNFYFVFPSRDWRHAAVTAPGQVRGWRHPPSSHRLRDTRVPLQRGTFHPASFFVFLAFLSARTYEARCGVGIWPGPLIETVFLTINIEGRGRRKGGGRADMRVRVNVRLPRHLSIQKGRFFWLLFFLRKVAAWL